MMKTKFIYVLFLFVCFALIINGCNNDEPIAPAAPSNSLNGYWNVDKIQMVQPPNTGTPSAIMKSALVPFGLMNAELIGDNTIRFGLEKWKEVYAGNTIFDKIKFLDNMNGWAAEKSPPALYYTGNGGNTWTNLNLNGINILYDFYFTNYARGYISVSNDAGENKLIQTTNKGVTWESISNGKIFNELFFINELTGFAYVSDNTFSRTTDGGYNWQAIINDVQSALIRFPDSQNGFILYKNSQGYSLSKTNNGGLLWQNTLSNSNYDFVDFMFLNQSTGWSIIKNGELRSIYQSQDAGFSWTKLNDNINAKEVNFVSATTGYALIDNCICYSTNSGVNWNITYGDNNKNIVDIYSFYQNKKCYGISSNGYFVAKEDNIDTSQWCLNGTITNPAIQVITSAHDRYYYALGNYTRQDSNVTFTVKYYTQGLGTILSGSGFIIINNNSAEIYLNLTNEEKWKIILKR